MPSTPCDVNTKIYVVYKKMHQNQICSQLIVQHALSVAQDVEALLAAVRDAFLQTYSPEPVLLLEHASSTQSTLQASKPDLSMHVVMSQQCLLPYSQGADFTGVQHMTFPAHRWLMQPLLNLYHAKELAANMALPTLRGFSTSRTAFRPRPRPILTGSNIVRSMPAWTPPPQQRFISRLTQSSWAQPKTDLRPKMVLAHETPARYSKFS